MPESASTKLEQLGARFAGRSTPVRLGELVDGLGPAGLGMAVLLLTLPALIPVPGPFGLVFGTVLALVAVQVMLGARRLWLPQAVRRRALSGPMLAAMVSYGVPLLRRLEHWTTPRRLLPLTGKVARMALALPLLVMAVALALPIPLGNVPPAASLIALALGLITRDGVAIVVGLGLAVLAAAWMTLLLLFGSEIARMIWGWIGTA